MSLKPMPRWVLAAQLVPNVNIHEIGAALK